jgi:hypothetical protein
VAAASAAIQEDRELRELHTEDIELKIKSAKNKHRLPAGTKIRQLNRIVVVVASTMSRSHKNHTTFKYHTPLQ